MAFRPNKEQDLDRRFDQTALRANAHGKMVHRDYAAHYFRWGFAGRFINEHTKVLDIGCGVDVPLGRLLLGKPAHPPLYVGVDLNRVKKMNVAWWRIHDQFNFIDKFDEIKHAYHEFEVVTCFEVIEHMHVNDGRKLINRIRRSLHRWGLALVSTPVYNGKRMAANHIHEWSVDELSKVFKASGLVVKGRYGTFMDANSIKQTDPVHRTVAMEISEYYSWDVIACFLAPLYPNLSKNNIWLLERSK